MRRTRRQHGLHKLRKYATKEEARNSSEYQAAVSPIPDVSRVARSKDNKRGTPNNQKKNGTDSSTSRMK
jgi:hypothetical protein